MEENATEYQQLLMERYAGTAADRAEEGYLISLLLGPKEYGFEKEMQEYLEAHPNASIVELDEYAEQFFPEIEIVDDDDELDEEDRNPAVYED